MRWSELSPAWQACLDETWQAFLHGTVPIGAVVTDEYGAVVARGRNRIYDDNDLKGQVNRNQLAHAELNAMLQFNRDQHDFRACAIYTSMEPCPLCMGAIYMMGIGHIHYAARDTYAGSTDMLKSTPYLSRKNIQVSGPPDRELENALIGLVIAFDLAHKHLPFHARINPVLAAWQAACPAGVALGIRLNENRALEDLVNRLAPAEDGFDRLFAELKNLPAVH